MQFRIADTFTDSLAKLTGDEQKAVKTAAFDLQMNPAHPGLKLRSTGRRTRTSGPCGSVATSGSSSTGPLPASCSATSIITTPPISGPNDGDWNDIRRQGLRNSSRSARRSARSVSAKRVERGHRRPRIEMAKRKQARTASESLHSDISRPFDRPESGRIAVKAI